MFFSFYVLPAYDYGFEIGNLKKNKKLSKRLQKLMERIESKNNANGYTGVCAGVIVSDDLILTHVDCCQQTYYAENTIYFEHVLEIREEWRILTNHTEGMQDLGYQGHSSGILKIVLTVE